MSTKLDNQFNCKFWGLVFPSGKDFECRRFRKLNPITCRSYFQHDMHSISYHDGGLCFRRVILGEISGHKKHIVWVWVNGFVINGEEFNIAVK